MLNWRNSRVSRKANQTDDSQGDQDANANGEEEPTRPVRVSEDFPLRVTKARTQLYPFLKSCLENETDAYLRYDTLVVEGQLTYTMRSGVGPYRPSRKMADAHVL